MTSEAVSFFPNAIVPETADTSVSQSAAVEDAPQSVLPICEASDEELLQHIGQQNRESLALLFRRYARTVRNIGCKILRNEAEADDLLQDVFLFIFEKAGQFDPSLGRAGTWIVHVAYHRAFDRRRYLSARHFYSSEQLEESTLRIAAPYQPPVMEHSMPGILGKELLKTYNDALSADQRQVIELHLMEGYPLKEVAEITQQSVTNVRSHYYRGLDRLRRFVLPGSYRLK
jgi:RNA polymerase sigma-70 factor (ECF subfamily)